jgi:hypothetical protein
MACAAMTWPCWRTREARPFQQVRAFEQLGLAQHHRVGGEGGGEGLQRGEGTGQHGRPRTAFKLHRIHNHDATGPQPATSETNPAKCTHPDQPTPVEEKPRALTKNRTKTASGQAQNAGTPNGQPRLAVGSRLRIRRRAAHTKPANSATPQTASAGRAPHPKSASASRTPHTKPASRRRTSPFPPRVWRKSRTMKRCGSGTPAARSASARRRSNRATA